MIRAASHKDHIWALQPTTRPHQKSTGQDSTVPVQPARYLNEHHHRWLGGWMDGWMDGWKFGLMVVVVVMHMHFNLFLLFVPLLQWLTVPTFFFSQHQITSITRQNQGSQREIKKEREKKTKILREHCTTFVQPALCTARLRLLLCLPE
jgi:hypothetical protein